MRVSGLPQTGRPGGPPERRYGRIGGTIRRRSRSTLPDPGDARAARPVAGAGSCRSPSGAGVVHRSGQLVLPGAEQAAVPVRDTVRTGKPQRVNAPVSPMCINGNGMGLDPSMK